MGPAPVAESTPPTRNRDPDLKVGEGPSLGSRTTATTGRATNATATTAPATRRTVPARCLSRRSARHVNHADGRTSPTDAAFPPTLATAPRAKSATR